MDTQLVNERKRSSDIRPILWNNCQRTYKYDAQPGAANENKIKSLLTPPYLSRATSYPITIRHRDKSSINDYSPPSSFLSVDLSTMFAGFSSSVSFWPASSFSMSDSTAVCLYRSDMAFSAFARYSSTFFLPDPLVGRR